MNDLIDQLEQLVDSGSERVKAMFAELHAAVPSPKELEFENSDEFGVRTCQTVLGEYRYHFPKKREHQYVGYVIGESHARFESDTERGIRNDLQVHFNECWSAMTDTGAAHGT